MKLKHIAITGFSILLLTGCESLPEPLRELDDRTAIENTVVEIEVSQEKQQVVAPLQLPNNAKLFERVHFSDYNDRYQFSADVPHQWEIEYIPQNKSINIYDLNDPAGIVRNKSQMLILLNEEKEFTLPEGFTISFEEERSISNHEAKLYDLAAAEGVDSFDHQPDWRIEAHRQVDIKASEGLVTIAKNPGVTDEALDQFLASIEMHDDTKSLREPIHKAKDRITKKPFGLYITPQNSPVSPERFVGYHTGTDFEIFPEEFDEDVPVYALCGGPIVQAGPIEGYGGLIIQKCTLNNETVTVLYGHVSTQKMVRAGEYKGPGQKIGQLAADHSEDTDQERKHLHVGIHKGGAIEYRGYAASEKQLEGWIDPCSLVCTD